MQNHEEAEYSQEVLINGRVLDELPQDLYIPPEALRVFLEAFQGPLDLLLYLIRKHNIDILDIPIAKITHQYMQYVEVMREIHLELAAEYLVMAAMLAEIKSRMLLPRPKTDEDEEEHDPRAELIRRLQEYERYKNAALKLDELPRIDRDNFTAEAFLPKVEVETPEINVSISEMLLALQDVLRRAHLNAKHKIHREPLSIRERMTIVLNKVNHDDFTPFAKLFTVDEGRMGVVVSFIAILELIRESIIELVQSEPYAPIYVKAKG